MWAGARRLIITCRLLAPQATSRKADDPRLRTGPISTFQTLLICGLHSAYANSALCVSPSKIHNLNFLAAADKPFLSLENHQRARAGAKINNQNAGLFYSTTCANGSFKYSHQNNCPTPDCPRTRSNPRRKHLQIIKIYG